MKKKKLKKVITILKTVNRNIIQPNKRNLDKFERTRKAVNFK